MIVTLDGPLEYPIKLLASEGVYERECDGCIMFIFADKCFFLHKNGAFGICNTAGVYGNFRRLNVDQINIKTK